MGELIKIHIMLSENYARNVRTAPYRHQQNVTVTIDEN